MSSVFENFIPYIGPSEPGHTIDFLGIRTSNKFYPNTSYSQPSVISPSFPNVDEELFEWIDLLTAIANSKHQPFVMMELGAGYGRWLVRAHHVLRLKKKEEYIAHLIAVEPEPQHFKWISQHFIDNQINPKHHALIHAAISDSNGIRKLVTNDKPEEWYGQALSSSGNLEVPTITISDLLEVISKPVDLLDMDIQGEELKALSHSAREVDHYVKLIHIGTHGSELEQGLRKLFTEMGWQCRFDFRCGVTEDTSYGAVYFQDGVQSWLNPKFI